MRKRKAEWSNNLSIFWLKKHGYLKGGIRHGGIKWTQSITGDENEISFTVTTKESVDDNVRLQYAYTNQRTNEAENMSYGVNLTTTRCYYGGTRYWFLCPLIKNGKQCRRRVGVLFAVGKWFGCRYCGDIVYAAQMKGGKFRGCSVSFRDIEQAEQAVKRYYYKGKLTRKYRRLMRLHDKFQGDFMRMKAHFRL